MFRKAVLFCFFVAIGWVLVPVGSVCAEDAAGPSLAQQEETQPEEGPALGGEEAEQDEQPEDGPALGGQDEEQEAGPGLAEEEEPTEPEEPEEPEMPEDAPEIEDEAEIYQELRELREKVEQLEREAEAREELRMTEEEERDEEEEILEAAGREYTLLQEGLLSLDLNVSYSYYSSDMIRQQREVEYQAQHNLTHSISVENAIRENLTVTASLPFVYKYDQVGTERQRDVTNIGDISLGSKYQPWKVGNRWPAPIFNLNLSLPTGRGQYDMDPAQDLSTGSGLYSLSTGVSLSQSLDPVNVFGGLTYNHSFSRDGIGQRRRQGILEKVDPGEAISANIGFGYALSYRTSLSLSYSYSYSFATDYHWADGTTTSGADSVSSSLSLSTSWRITPERSIIVGLSTGLTNDDQDFGLSLRIPMEYDLR